MCSFSRSSITDNEGGELWQTKETGSAEGRAAISSGRKASGTVTFEVPDEASVVEVEYAVSVWTSNRVVFTCAY